MRTQEIINIEKELITAISFSKEDVLNERQAKDERCFKLFRALNLGNLSKEHVKIKFYNEAKELMSTRVTIWGVTRTHVILKAGVLLPISSILSVD